MALRDSLDNAEFALNTMIPELRSGAGLDAQFIQSLCMQYRCRGVCRMLTEGLPDGLYASTVQEVGAYLHWLGIVDPKQQVGSWANPFHMAVGMGHWDAARAIAARTRTQHDPDNEYEDDFLYVRFLMQRYLLSADQATQAQTLTRFEQVLAGDPSPRRDLCQALLDGDQRQAEASAGDVMDARQAQVERMVAEGKMPEVHAEWIRPLSPEGLSLLRLLEREGWTPTGPFAGVPDLARAPSPLFFDPDAWQTPNGSVAHV